MKTVNLTSDELTVFDALCDGAARAYEVQKLMAGEDAPPHIKKIYDDIAALRVKVMGAPATLQVVKS
jgi:hypothetical protein